MTLDRIVRRLQRELRDECDPQVCEAYMETETCPDEEAILDALLEAQEEVVEEYKKILGQNHPIHQDVEMNLHVQHLP